MLAVGIRGKSFAAASSAMKKVLRVQLTQTTGQKVYLECFGTAASLSLHLQGEPHYPSSFTLQPGLQLDPASLGYLIRCLATLFFSSFFHFTAAKYYFYLVCWLL